MDSLLKIILMVLGTAKFIMIVHIAMSWLINFQVLNVRQPFVYQVWDGLNRLLDPVYSRIRRFLPDTGSLDLAPLIAFFCIMALEIIVGDTLMGAR